MVLTTVRGGGLAAGARERAVALLLFISTIWAVSLAGFLFNARMGVQPRSVSGLLGILVAPWFHANWAHLLSNTLPLLVLGWFTMLPRKADFAEAVLGGLVGAGAAAWLLGGPHTLHLGASGLVFGLFGYVLARGLYQRQFVGMALAMVAAAVYGSSMALGLLPMYPGVSWQSHVGGAVGGFLMAKFSKAS